MLQLMSLEKRQNLQRKSWNWPVVLKCLQGRTLPFNCNSNACACSAGPWSKPWSKLWAQSACSYICVLSSYLANKKYSYLSRATQENWESVCCVEQGLSFGLVFFNSSISVRETWKINISFLIISYISCAFSM